MSVRLFRIQPQWARVAVEELSSLKPLAVLLGRLQVYHVDHRAVNVVPKVRHVVSTLHCRVTSAAWYNHADSVAHCSIIH